MSVIDRILLFIKLEDIPVSAFEKKAGLGNGYISKIKISPSPQKCEDILKAYPKLNREWLLIGKGEMYLEEKNSIEVQLEEKDTSSSFDPSVFIEMQNKFDVREERLLAIIESQQRTIETLSDNAKKILARGDNAICAAAAGSD